MNFINQLKENSIKQQTEEWFQKRIGMVTGSVAGTICNYNSYQTKEELIQAKVKDVRFNNIFTEHGNKYEDVAVELFEQKNNVKVEEIGLVVHRDYPYIGASPDGIFLDNDNQVCLLEIKCPYRRKITGDIPIYYYAQVQLQLEATNLEKCYFYECKIVEYDTE